MKPSQALNLSARVLLALTLLLVCPLLLPAQSKDKKSNPPPPPQQQRQQPQQQQRQQPQQQQRPANAQQSGGNAGRSTTGAVNGGNAGRGATGAANGRNASPRSVPQNLQSVRDAKGMSTYKDKATGRQWETNSKGAVTRFSEPGREVKFGGTGKPTFIRDEKRGIIIDHGQHGERHIITEHRDANHRIESRVVSTGSNRGFVEHRMERGGHEYMRRTY